MPSTNKLPKQLSQTTISFPTRKSSSTHPKASAKNEKDSKNGVAPPEERVKVAPSLVESRAQAAEARAKAPLVPKSRLPAPKLAKTKAVNVDSEAEDTDIEDFENEPSDEEEIEEPPEVVVTDKDEGANKPAVHGISSGSEDEKEIVIGKGKHKNVGLRELVKEPSFKKHYDDVKLALGGELTDSAKGESKATTILRRWDLSYEYGPCVGFTRMERWERAEGLGLKPPQMVRLILGTGKADRLTDAEFETLNQSVMNGLV